MLSSRGRLLRGIGLLARLGLAAVWLISGAIKVADPGQTYLAVQAYDVLPEPLVGVVATAMPLAELVFGALLLFGAATRLTALASAALLVVFIARGGAVVGPRAHDRLRLLRGRRRGGAG